MKLSRLNRSLFFRIHALRPEMVAAAQKVYDEWDQEDDLDGGGICDGIAEAISHVLAGAGIDVTDGGHDGDDHAYAIAYDETECFVVDIQPDVYETGSGYSWTKIPDVVFTDEDIMITRTHRPDWI